MKKKGLSAVFFLLILVFLDQCTKYVAVMRLKSQPHISIIKDVLELVYLENTGSAWGMLSGKKMILIIITFILSGIVITAYFKLPEIKRYNMARMLTIVLLSGAIGNLIDRIRVGYVIDFIYVSAIDFPVFNLADSYVTLSILLILLFYRKEIREWMKNG